MITGQKTISLKAVNQLKEKLTDYHQLVKFRLTSLVVFSSSIGFLLGTPWPMAWGQFWILVIGGFLIVSASNMINQIIERKDDKKMTRTATRPLAQNRMSVTEAKWAALITGLSGVILMGWYLNTMSTFLSFLGLIIYAFAYTPLKKISPVAVFVGAIAGAIPPMAGYAAANGSLDTTAWSLFVLQFFWQFPHFWAIAWVMHDDYSRAGFKLLPLGAQKDRLGALQIVMFTLVLLPLSLLPAKMGLIHLPASLFCMLASLTFFIQSVFLYLKLTNRSALHLMFGSFIYLPVIFIVFLLDKWF